MIMKNDNGLNSKNDDIHSIWRHWFQSHEYQSIYSPSPFQERHTKHQIQPLLHHPSLDKQSQNMIQMLQRMALPTASILEVAVQVDRGGRNDDDEEEEEEEGTTTTIHKNNIMVQQTTTLDIITTQQCNYMITNKLSNPQIRKQVKGLSHRAYMIWKKMEYCHTVRTDLHPNTYHTNGTTYHPLYTTPKPNRDTYLSVLKLHSIETEDPEAPERAYEIIQVMIQRHDQEPSWDTQPSSLIWNQCISSWANNTAREDKAYQVANFIFNIIPNEYLDISSYGHAFKACATCSTSRGKELASNVLVRLWKHFKENSNVLPMTTIQNDSAKERNKLQHDTISNSTNTPKMNHRGSLTFVHMFHALQLISDEHLKNILTKEVLTTVQTCGWMNAHVIKAYCNLVSKGIMEETFGIYVNKGTEGISTDNKFGHIYQNIPKHWKRHCKTNKFGW